MKKPSKQRKEKDNIFKATIIIRLKDGAIVYGEGTVEGLVSVDGKALITARFYKNFPKNHH